jgi:hypothetical protein
MLPSTRARTIRRVEAPARCSLVVIETVARLFEWFAARRASLLLQQSRVIDHWCVSAPQFVAVTRNRRSAFDLTRGCVTDGGPPTRAHRIVTVRVTIRQSAFEMSRYRRGRAGTFGVPFLGVIPDFAFGKGRSR